MKLRWVGNEAGMVWAKISSENKVGWPGNGTRKAWE